MPVTISYPGVYIEEVPSSVRTITGVPTSVTAFVGRAWRGPTDEPVRISSNADYEILSREAKESAERAKLTEQTLAQAEADLKELQQRFA